MQETDSSALRFLQWAYRFLFVIWAAYMYFLLALAGEGAVWEPTFSVQHLLSSYKQPSVKDAENNDW